MSFVYAGLWFVIGLVLLIRMTRENRVFIAAGAYFLVLGAWWLVDGLRPEGEVFSGTPGIVFRVVSGAALVLCGVVFLLERRRMLRREEEERSGKK